MPSDTTAMRDELAQLCGFCYIPDTIDGAAACMPDGVSWVVERFINGNGDLVFAGRVRKGPDCLAALTDFDDEKELRFALALAARKAKGTA